MKRLVFALLLVCMSAASAAETVELSGATLPLDVKASRAKFNVQHLLIEHVSGSVPIVSAEITLGADGVSPVAVNATLDPTRINTGDDDRDGAITGSDWFDTKKFPLWTFTSDHVAKNPDGTYGISGTLTIHGVAVPVTLLTTLVQASPRPRYHATVTVDRHAFGMVVTRVDALVGKDVTIDLDVQVK